MSSYPRQQNVGASFDLPAAIPRDETEGVMLDRLVPTLGLAILLTACSDSSQTPPVDICNDRAWGQCAYVAEDECGLSAHATESELDRCKPFVRCDNAVFDRCMKEHGQ